MSTPPLAELLPLRAPALLLERVESWDADRARVRARVPATSPFVDGAAVPAHVALEVAAQAAGAHGRLVQHAAGPLAPAREGYLVVARDAAFARAAFAADAPLVVDVAADGAAGPLGLYRFTVRDAEGAIAEGVLGTYLPDDGQRSRQQNH